MWGQPPSAVRRAQVDCGLEYPCTEAPAVFQPKRRIPSPVRRTHLRIILTAGKRPCTLANHKLACLLDTQLNVVAYALWPLLFPFGPGFPRGSIILLWEASCLVVLSCPHSVTVSFWRS